MIMLIWLKVQLINLDKLASIIQKLIKDNKGSTMHINLKILINNNYKFHKVYLQKSFLSSNYHNKFWLMINNRYKLLKILLNNNKTYSLWNSPNHNNYNRYNFVSVTLRTKDNINNNNYNNNNTVSNNSLHLINWLLSPVLNSSNKM